MPAGRGMPRQLSGFPLPTQRYHEILDQSGAIQPQRGTASECGDWTALTVAHDEANAFDAVVPPIVQTSLFTFGSYDEFKSLIGIKQSLGGN